MNFDMSMLPDVGLDDPYFFYENLNLIREAFNSGHELVDDVREAAKEYANIMERYDRFIQRYTEITCPYCGTVCCANRHGIPDFADLVMFIALDLEIPTYRFIPNDEAPCQFISEKGCILRRIIRPYRCTWYFCDPLLKQIEIDKPIVYRQFIHDSQELSKSRQKTLALFWRIWTDLGY